MLILIAFGLIDLTLILWIVNMRIAHDLLREEFDALRTVYFQDRELKNQSQTPKSPSYRTMWDN